MKRIIQILMVLVAAMALVAMVLCVAAAGLIVFGPFIASVPIDYPDKDTHVVSGFVAALACTAFVAALQSFAIKLIEEVRKLEQIQNLGMPTNPPPD